MSTADAYVRARVDTATKERAADALQAMGTSISDAIGLLMLRVADERRLPFEVKAPNKTTRKAIAELEAGKVLGSRLSVLVESLLAEQALAESHRDHPLGGDWVVTASATSNPIFC